MALIIENGSIVAGAQSYATVAELRAYAAERKGCVPESDAECEALLIGAMDRIRSEYGPRFVGEKVSRAQLLDWPRTGAVVDNFPLNSNEIPREVVWGQCALAFDAHKVGDLLPATAAGATGPIVEETVGPITVAYANTGNLNRLPASARADAFMAVLTRNRGLFLVRA